MPSMSVLPAPAVDVPPSLAQAPPAVADSGWNLMGWLSGVGGVHESALASSPGEEAPPSSHLEAAKPAAKPKGRPVKKIFELKGRDPTPAPKPLAGPTTDDLSA